MNTSNLTWPTRHTLPADSRAAVSALLNQQLVDLIDLGLQAKQAHWNVKGPQFVSLHQLFDEVAEEAGEAADEVAERAVELGGVTTGTLRQVAAATRLPMFPSEALRGSDHVTALIRALVIVTTSTRVAIEEATTRGDPSSADVLTEVSRSLDKLLWKVEAHTLGG